MDLTDQEELNYRIEPNTAGFVMADRDPRAARGGKGRAERKPEARLDL